MVPRTTIQEITKEKKLNKIDRRIGESDEFQRNDNLCVREEKMKKIHILKFQVLSQQSFESHSSSFAWKHFLVAKIDMPPNHSIFIPQFFFFFEWNFR